MVENFFQFLVLLIIIRSIVRFSTVNCGNYNGLCLVPPEAERPAILLDCLQTDFLSLILDILKSHSTVSHRSKTEFVCLLMNELKSGAVATYCQQTEFRGAEVRLHKL